MTFIRAPNYSVSIHNSVADTNILPITINHRILIMNKNESLKYKAIKRCYILKASRK